MDYKFKKSSVRGRLSPDDLFFFYYEIAKNSELGGLYELSNEELIVTAKESGLELKPIKQLSFTDKTHSPKNNELYFTYLKNNRRNGNNIKEELSYQTALFTHLRNSFSHYRISYEGNLLLLEDGFNNKYTMKSCVEMNKLKQMIFKIIEYSDNKLAQVNI